MDKSKNSSLKKKSISFPFVTSLLFAGSFIAAKYTTYDLGPLTTSLLRYIVALLFLSLLVIFKKKDSLKIEIKDVPMLLILGLSGIVGYHYFFFTALRYTEVANTAIINAFSPIVTALMAAIFLKERLTLKNYAGVIAAVTGVLILLTKGDIDNLIGLKINMGDGLMLLSVLSWVVYALFIKSLSKKYAGFTLTFYATLAGVVLLFVIALKEDYIHQTSNISLTSLCSVIYMGIFASGIGYLLYNLSIANIGPTKTSGFVYSCVPVFVAVLSFIFFNQPVTFVMILSILLIITALRFIMKNEKNKA